MRWLASTIGKRGYIADYLRACAPGDTIVIGTGNVADTVGFAACDRAYLMPPIASADYPERVLALCEHEAIEAVLTLSDLDVARLAPLRPRLVDRGIACFFPGETSARTFLDKRLTAVRLAEHGIAVPRSWPSVAAAMASGLQFPAVVKPALGSASAGYRKVERAEELASAAAEIAEPIVQEFFEGRLVNVEVCSDVEGRPLAGAVWERLESSRGETGSAVTIEHPEALDLVRAVLERFPVPGPIDVDLIETPAGLVLLEVNTRFGGGYPVTQLAGGDFPGLMRASLQGRSPERFDRYRRGVRMMKALVPIAFERQAMQAPEVGKCRGG